ncbi:OB-fold domain-containing protein [Jatrophihabitans cynanchi]|uniref:OB-fold domain-containing protein n=1 Tax=Jatrophihabitans cynanchi TaxID=2944128 RepID=A0ABY7K5B8_9ACTN|nr:OB-fold domain-containing protein [Jatrophihabitans sp. SB3-54]WAX58471.1 OB-fold domain-containing protein [Jatrophihabitans sp. SB3-54]
MTDQPRGLIAPVMDADSAAWWGALAEGVLLLQQCDVCGRDRCPPLPCCPYCGSPGARVVPASGAGSVYSWTTVRRSLAPAFVGDEPYTVLAVNLDEGPRLFGRLLAGSLSSGARVWARCYEVDGQTLLGFVEAGAA